ncbi:energy-coupling factor transporter transmembrane component T family protein [Carboxylicivirga sp. RSCT41]|uniref:energy-coupling factor transporter transmembrane component T family protein n=1 Tax=Carboxylicivirga agarovorans TaxID=3417570 RepID=UPI003D34B228
MPNSTGNINHVAANRLGTTCFLSGTGEKILLVTLWLLLAISIHQWLTQCLMLLTGILGFTVFLPRSKKEWRFFLVAGTFILTGTLGLIVETGSISPGAILHFSVFGVWWNITEASMAHAGLTAIKALNGLCAIRLAMLCLSFEEAMSVARRLHLPDVLIEQILLSYRYLFGIKNTANEVMLAQRQRLGYGTFRNSMRSFAGMLAAVFIKSLRLSLQNYQAMQVRGYHGHVYCPEKWEKSSLFNVLCIAALAGGFVALSFYRL